jgi:dTDP-4-dehydrorhamnose 3,5-epimerase
VRTLIDGVQILEVKHVPTANGSLRELYRADWEGGGAGVGGAFIATIVPGRVSAWHVHRRTVDRLSIVAGRVRVVLFDARTTSPTFGLCNDDLIFGDIRPALIVVPPGVWHGLQNIGAQTASVVNLVSQAYDYEHPDHLRLPEDTDQIPFRFRHP